MKSKFTKYWKAFLQEYVYIKFKNILQNLNKLSKKIIQKTIDFDAKLKINLLATTASNEQYKISNKY